jgi:predicted helicase
LSFIHEGAVAPHFSKLLQSCGQQFKWTLIEQYPIPRKNRQPLKADGVLLDEFKLIHGIWEAKDTHDDLPTEAKKKFQAGYPQDNILFQAPDRAMLYQNGNLVIDTDINQPANLIDALKLFFEYQPPEYEQWDLAVEEFKDKVPELANSLLKLIEAERQYNKHFVQSLNDFIELVRQAINPNISMQAVEEMLIQHLLTERIFRTVFKNPDFANRNIIAVEIEKVIQALTSRHFSRTDFLNKLDRFYGAIETTAATIDDFSQKQDFLNTVYEKFFQGFSIKVADTHGIVYTPQPIVDFMVRSVDDILQREFGKSLGHKDVHILDPFVGTGNFILRTMRQIPKTQLANKYVNELHCNEVMLLPYYIAAMNIEHTYFELTGQYQPFDGICLVDTFELAEGRQMPMFVQANTQRVEQQKQTPIFVVIGNPPYNASQVNENDNNKNRKYEEMDRRTAATYAKDSTATLKSQLSDPYVKAIRWATDRIGDDGVVTLVTNNSFLDDKPFDGMRKHLAQDFNRIYILDLKGNIRKDSMRDGIPLGEKHTVFGLAAMVGISVTFFVRRKELNDYKIFYSTVDFRSTRQEKFDLIENAKTIKFLKWTEIVPDHKYNWLTENLRDDFDTFIPTGTKEAKEAKYRDTQTIFKLYSTGAKTNRDVWVYNFQRDILTENMRQTIETYNSHIFRLQPLSTKPVINDFVSNDDTKISWSRDLKLKLQRGQLGEFNEDKIRVSLYRPFTKRYLFFDKIFADVLGFFPNFFPTQESENDNRVICCTNHSQLPFLVQMSNHIPDTAVGGRPGQCFPFYTYNKDGSNRRENITDYALKRFHTQYQDDTITKWDIFYYVYALLHHPTYCDTYAANLRRDLPNIPFADEFWGFAEAGTRLADMHVNYEQQPEYPLKLIENPDEPLNWRVEKMRLSKDKTQLKYNDFLTLAGIPPEAFEYKLGNRSALDWVIDQYRVKTDKRSGSGIVNDPNNLDDEQYIVRLVGQVITVSLETVKIVKDLPELNLE